MKNQDQFRIKFGLYGWENPLKSYNWGIDSWKKGKHHRYDGIQILIPGAGVTIYNLKNIWTPPVVQYYRFQRECMLAAVHIEMICNDPMNGCPEDFAEDFSHQHRGDEMKIYNLERKCWKWTRKIADYFLAKEYYKLAVAYNDERDFY